MRVFCASALAGVLKAITTWSRGSTGSCGSTASWLAPLECTSMQVLSHMTGNVASCVVTLPHGYSGLS
jgi:hypothetical protein